MNFPKNIEEKLGFDKIKEIIREGCTSELSSREVDKIRFLFQKDLVQKLNWQTVEFSKVLGSGEKYVPIHHIDSLQHLKKIKIPGSFTESQNLNEIRIFVEGANENLTYFSENRSEYPQLFKLIENSIIDQKLPEKIKSKINDKGEVRDDATPELRKIRKDIVSRENKTRKIINEVISKSKREGQTPDDASVTIRNGRLVIPVKSEYKRNFKGFVHDVSSTGQTSFIEPAEILELNNEVIELKYQEHREIVRIMVELCDRIRENYQQIENIYFASAKLDFIKAKAKFCLKTKAVCPEINSTKVIEYKKARHPVLESNLSKQGKKIVPQDILLNPSQRILVISGPNAGGKTVTLKTLGLMQYMFQCGIPVPVDEGSSTCLFESIFIDIGDEQSIENDLSTYSSHLKNMSHFVQFANKNVLFLIDEFGTGTDPKFGGAMAEAILKELLASGSCGALSTHYSNLKKFADNKEGIVNARMRFDMTHLEPLFQLEIGKPGSSFAFEIASKIGIPENIIKQARKIVGYDEVQLDNLLNELESEKGELQKKLESATKKESLLENTIKHYEELKEMLDEKKKEILNNAKREASSILQTANQKIESAIFEIKKSKAQKETIKEQKSNVEDFKEKLKVEKTRPKEKIKVLSGPLKVGDSIRIKGSEAIGEVTRISKKSAEVTFGTIKSNVNISKLEKVAYKHKKPPQSRPVKKLNFDINDSKSNFSSELDLRGSRVEEAYGKLKQFMDNGIMFDSRVLRIVHGKGNGVLRGFIRDELSQYREVEKVEDEHADRGGAGVTIVYLR